MLKETDSRRAQVSEAARSPKYAEREKDSNVLSQFSRNAENRNISIEALGLCGLLALQLCTSVGCGTLGSRELASSLPPITNPESVAAVALAEPARLSLSDSNERETDLPPTRVSPQADVVSVAHEEPIYGVVSPSDTIPAYAVPLSAGETIALGETYQVPLGNPVASFSGVACSDDCGSPTGDSACVAGCSGGNCGCPTPTMALPRNVQEYIFDGGDQQPSVAVNKDWTAVGVDPTDTVIYYETLDGKVCVRPSNRVPIYAPRFGAVRQVSGIVLAARAAGTERILAPVTPGAFQEADLIGNLNGPLAPQAEQQIGMLDRFQENRRGIPIAQSVPPKRFSAAQKAFESIEFLTTGMMLDHEIPVIGRILANARTWYTPESIGVMIDGQAAGLVVDSKRTQDVHVYEMPDRCAMRICKGASHTIANSGDIVSFTIRFDNVGPKPLGNAVILDSLSPRLEYIEGSQQSSLQAKFSSSPNEVGSSTLRWEIEPAIKSSDGGVISFDCRVR